MLELWMVEDLSFANKAPEKTGAVQKLRQSKRLVPDSHIVVQE